MRAGTTGYFIGHAALTGLFCHAGFESRTAAIAQLGYFMQHTTGLFHAITQLGYFVMLGSNLTR